MSAFELPIEIEIQSLDLGTDRILVTLKSNDNVIMSEVGTFNNEGTVRITLDLEDPTEQPWP